MDNFFRWLFFLIIKTVVAFAISALYLGIRTSLVGDTGQLPMEESVIVFLVSIVLSCLIIRE